MTRRQILTGTLLATLFDPPTEPINASWCAIARCPPRTSPWSGAAVAIKTVSAMRSCCYLRHSGRPLKTNERPPSALVSFIAGQIDALPEAIDEYLAVERNRQCHAIELQDQLGLRPFGARPAAELSAWLLPHAIENDRLAYLAGLAMEECRRE